MISVMFDLIKKKKKKPISSVTRGSPSEDHCMVVVPWGSSHHMPARTSDASALRRGIWPPQARFGMVSGRDREAGFDLELFSSHTL